ncbi:septal ring lytic transglycosylase RlpA family protein [Hymenobacter sp. HDW8]|uniref:septal ring lytic transglycosylase RlpA family protein n=1 Tax=Hymenobacter sp. HDW8 TaxID=2714932 RepID=UPI00140BD0D4|nr:septal ring lytic transglycosylase RlpA family protein [Hymenobacter sp. HDW8]QIL76701.1 septal ring lytic transglycosylase RlpA family protein [Hymenobacter sp. HDW8]
MIRSLRLPLAGWLFALLLTLPLAFPQTAFATRLSDDDKAPTATTRKKVVVLRGRASWYGIQHQGLPTSSGERFDRNKYTAAHKTLPFNTRLRVTNPQNGKSVVVRVTDRGPFRHQRILDLAEIAARPLGIIQQGAISVVAEVVPETTPLGPTDAPEDLAEILNDTIDPEMPVVATTETSVPATLPASTAAYVVQTGTFGSALNAQNQLIKIQSINNKLVVTVTPETVNGKALNRVVVGQFADRKAADAVRRQLQQRGITGLVRQIQVPIEPAAHAVAAGR